MTRKHRAGFGRALLKFVLIVPAVMSLVSHLCALAQSELLAVRKKIILGFFLAISCMVLLFSVWIGVDSLALLYLLSLKLTLMQALTITLLVNLLLFVIAFLSLSLMKIDLSFPNTRKNIKQMISD